MLKKISFITSVLFFLIGTTVFAHSHLEDSTPQNGEVVTTALKEKTSEAATVNNTADTGLPANSVNTSAPTLKNYILPGSVCFLIIIGVASYWLFYRRKQI